MAPQRVQTATGCGFWSGIDRHQLQYWDWAVGPSSVSRKRAPVGLFISETARP